MKETHLFILWENARYKEKEILEDIKKSFNIIGKYNITWNKEIFSKNLSRFYGTNLPKNSGKEQHCGNGDFLLIIVEVDNPKYEQRDTLSKGIQIVNINMFDKKTYYRELTGGGHKVHATNSEKETNHDLTLLLGKSLKDFLKEVEEKDDYIINLKQDLIGTDGFKTVKEMFYVLNNCIDYAILRNYETLPEEIYTNEHNDIDIICDSYENAAYILNAEKVFPEEYRIHYKVKVEDKMAFFDLRYIGDNYYYYNLEKSLLENRIYNSKGFYTVSEEEYFYTLLYHAILHKPTFSEDYKNKLNKMRPSLDFKDDEKSIQILNNWLVQKGYSITIPIDKSVLFNKENAKKFDRILGIEQIKKEELIENLQKEKDILAEELQRIVNSKSWRITEPIRNFRTNHKRK